MNSSIAKRTAIGGILVMGAGAYALMADEACDDDAYQACVDQCADEGGIASGNKACWVYESENFEACWCNDGYFPFPLS